MSEITVDGRGNVYVNSINFDFADFEEVMASGKTTGQDRPACARRPGPRGRRRARVPQRHGRHARQPHADRRRVLRRQLTAFDIDADGSLDNRRCGPGNGDGICLDADGASGRCEPPRRTVCQRVREGGEALDRIELDRSCYACMLGGDDGRTLFMVLAKWFGPDKMDELIEAKTGQVLVADAPAPGVGWP